MVTCSLVDRDALIENQEIKSNRKGDKVDSKSDAKKRIEAYYNALLQHKNEVEDVHTKKTIEFVVSSMDENEAAEAEQEIIKKDKD